MLTDHDHAIIRFEQEYGQLPRWEKVSAMRRELGLSQTMYAARLGRIIHDPGALPVAPQLIYRLRRIEAQRMEEREARLLRRDE